MKRAKFKLTRESFRYKEETILEIGGITVTAFRYSTGVRALRFSNSKGFIILLPFRGQQVWDAVFNGRRLTMESMYDEPMDVDNFLGTYGCFIMHCGARRMGCPGPEDDHPLHGELPYAKYNEVFIETGENEKGIYAGLSGVFHYNQAFQDKYDARPSVRFYENSGVFDFTIEVENLSNYPMDLMYMAHINFLPQLGTEIFQSPDWDQNAMKIRKSIPAHVRVQEGFIDFLEKLEKEPGLTKTIREEDMYDPEICFTFTDLKTSEDGKARFIQRHKDGSGDYVCYNPALLDRTTRWIMRTKNQKAFGLALPATCESEGYSAEKAKGNIKIIEPGASVLFEIEVGYLEPEETENIIKYINK